MGGLTKPCCGLPASLPSSVIALHSRGRAHLPVTLMFSAQHPRCNLSYEPRATHESFGAAVFSAPAISYHGPLTTDDLSGAAVCIAQMAQVELDAVLQRPFMISDGQKWGQRVIATTSKRVGSFVAPQSRWSDGTSVFSRLELCAQMMQNASDGQSMAMIVPMSLAKGFLKRGHCGKFAVAPQLMFSQMETSPHFIMYGSHNAAP